ncbi:hypothetical protein OG306_33385 [Streptomyces sp. NBC_01241]|uniref:hypothetical protein n=1 Tax=Streptomyces sp. NBC_01241 TaxID=2903794 RepID=UPI00352E7046|nr:hypothetical protein OG306_33385 [Streptomyces sp. NBC_01241]
MELTQLALLKASIDDMSLSDLRLSILVEMRNKPVFSQEVSEYMLQSYTDKLGELYY